MSFKFFRVFIFTSLFLLFTLLSQTIFASVTPYSQLVNLNLQIKTKNAIKSSNIMMPFYQTAELEKMIGNRNVIIELNPKRGKDSEEINLEVRFLNASGAKAFFKKEIIAKVNQLSKVSYKGLSIQIKPVLN